MQRQWTIEIRADFADEGKNDAIRDTMRSIARHALATVQLLSDIQKPQISIFSDDFFSGHEEISLMGDLIEDGKNEIGSDGSEHPEQISDELLQAFGGTDGANKGS